ncbi:MAG: hypothetical protein ACOYOK_09000, partial [Pseudobdellovibrionaceae bacterium]
MKHLLFVLIFAFSINDAVAELKITNISGASAINDDFTAIYAGIAGTCSSTDGVSTCDSCTGSGRVVCNHNSIYPSLPLEFSLQSSDASGSVDIYIQVTGSTTTTVEKVSTTLSANSSFTIATTWGTLCSKITGLSSSCVPTSCSSSTGADCTVDANITVGIDANNDGAIDTDNSKSLSVGLQYLYTSASTVNSLSGN